MTRTRILVGLLLAKVFPKRAEGVRKNFTIPDYWGNDRNDRLIEKLIRPYIAYEARSQEQQTPGIVEGIHKDFWEHAKDYYSLSENRAHDVYIPAYKDLVNALPPMLADQGIQTVCEFGTGDGKWLEYLSQQWPNIRQFIGIDLSRPQVERNQETYKDLTFVQSDILEWAEANATPNTLYHTNGGVLEYLSEGSMKRLIQILKARAPGSMLLLIEPLHGDYDTSTETNSRILGYEQSYTHNYVHLLKAGGLEVASSEERQVMGFRMQIVLAHIKKQQATKLPQTS